MSGRLRPEDKSLKVSVCFFLGFNRLLNQGLIFGPYNHSGKENIECQFKVVDYISVGQRNTCRTAVVAC